MRRFLISCASVAAFLVAPHARAQLVGIESDTGMLYDISFSGGPVQLSLIKDTGIVGIASLDFYDGSLYGFTSGSSPTLYELSPQGDVLGSVSLDLLFTNEGALAIAADGTGYGMNSSFSFSPKLFHFSLENGLLLDSPIDVGLGAGGARDINGLAWLPATPERNGVGPLLGLDRVEGGLITIDPSTGATALDTIVPNVGNFGVGGVGGMVADDEGQIYFNTAGPGGDKPGSNVLYRFDPDTHALEPIGSLGTTISGSGISGLAIVPEPATISLLALGALAFLCRPRRWRLATASANRSRQV